MEKKTKIEDVYKTIKAGTKQVEMYIASDGREFTGRNAERDCSLYELALLRIKMWNNITHVDLEELVRLPVEWWYASNEEELEMIKNHVGFYDKYNYIHVNDEKIQRTSTKPCVLNVGDWIGYIFDDAGDYRGDTHIYTKSYIAEKLSAFNRRFTGF